MKKIVLLLSTLFVTSVSAATKLAPQTIASIETGWGQEGLHIRTVEGLKADGCNLGAYMIPAEDFSKALYETHVSMLLSAFHAKKQVGLYVDGCIGDVLHVKAVEIIN